MGLALCLGASTAAYADSIDDYVIAQMKRQHIPGLSLAVLKNGKQVKVKAYGSVNLELGIRATPRSVYKIGSLSKQFIAAGIVLLIKDGKVGLDDSVRKYLPDAPETWQPITVRHLLTHTAGLGRESPAFDPMKVQSDAELIRAAYTTPLAFQPGEKWVYSNLGYFVLAEIISRAAEKPWPQYLEERVFSPLGMSATRTTTVEDLVPNRASGYNWLNNEFRNAEIVLALRPSGAFLSSVLDLAKWDTALYSDGWFSPELRELLWTPVKLNGGSEAPYGFGWRVDQVRGHRQVHHAGTLPGFRSQMARFVDDRLTVIVLTNSGMSQPERIALRVAAFYIPDLLPNRRTTKLPAQVLDRYVGQYQLTDGRVLNVARDDNRLTLTMTRGPLSMDLGLLAPESQTRFFNEDDPRLTYSFVTDSEGRMQLVTENEQGVEVEEASRVNTGK